MSVKRLLPEPAADVDPLTLYGNEDRPPRADRPYVLVNMVASLDGATTVGGITAGLGSPTDRAIFFHLRNLADAILVGASTVRAERYGPARPTTEVRDQRIRRGQTVRPPIAVVSRSIAFDWDSTFFTEADPRPVLIVPDDANPATLERARKSADVLTCGTSTVDLAGALRQLKHDGVDVLLCEGGPTINSELSAAGLVDEICLTVAPLLVGGLEPRGIFAPHAAVRSHSLALRHILEEDGFLYLRYVVSGQAEASRS